MTKYKRAKKVICKNCGALIVKDIVRDHKISM